jgi:hypothetical protein
MKKNFSIFIILCIIALFSCIIGYVTTTTTTNLSLVKPAEDDDSVNWFDTMNDNLDLIDAAFSELTTYLTDLDTESELESQLTDVTDVYTDNDFDISDYALTTALADYYLKTAIDSIGEMETIWGVDIIDSTENSDSDDDLSDNTLDDLSDVNTATITNRYVLVADGTDFESRLLVEADISDLGTYLTGITGESIGDLSDVDLTDIADTKILQYNTATSKWECETAAAGGVGELSDLSDVNTSTPTDKYVLVADGVDFESRQLTSDDLSDVASIAMLDENEIVTGHYYFNDYMYLRRESDSKGTQPVLYFYRSRSGDPTYDVSNGDYLGSIKFYGYVFDIPTMYLQAAEIRAIVDGTPGEMDMPGRLEFLTTLDGSTVPSLRMAIDNAGNFKHGDGVWTNYVNITNAGVLSLEGTANIEGVDATEFGYLDGVASDIQTQINARLEAVVDDTTPELGGEMDAGAHSIGFTLQTVAEADGTTTIDWKDGNHCKVTLGAQDETFTFTAPSNPCNLTLIIVQDATGGRDITWPATVKWLGTEATWTDGGASKGIVVGFIYDGTNYWGQATPWES